LARGWLAAGGRRGQRGAIILGLDDLVRDDRALRDKAQMLANLDHRREQVVDARDAGRFTGRTVDTVHDLAGGHIPGARNLPFTRLLTEDGRFRPAEELRAAFVDAGIDLHAPLTGTCGSGVTHPCAVRRSLLGATGRCTTAAG
jgi:thiosulfate/3-mercaptopyruvate sulfurtransferase